MLNTIEASFIVAKGTICCKSAATPTWEMIYVGHFYESCESWLLGVYGLILIIVSNLSSRVHPASVF